MQSHDTIRGRVAGLHVPVPPIPRWAVIPAALGCALLLAAGIVVGTAVGNDPAAAGTTVLKVVQSGKVVTEHGGVKKIVIPPKTVIKHGRPVTLPARTVALGSTATAQVFLPGRTFVRNGRTVTAPGTTRTSTVTTTAPGTTVTTVVTSIQTSTATVVSTVTLPGTTVTVTVSS